MCLYLRKNYRIQTAKKDIPCYKVIYKRGEKEYLSVFQMHKVSLGKEYSTDPIRAINKSNIRTVEKAFHSFASKKDAIIFSRKLKWTNPVTTIKVLVIETIIPKGTKYYEGTFDYIDDINNYKKISVPSYASQKIIYTKNIVFTKEN